MTQALQQSEESVLSDILNELRLQSAQTSELWDKNDIARYFKMSKSHVAGRILCKPHFPRPVIIPTTDIGGSKRWYAKEVKDWVKKFRKTG